MVAGVSRDELVSGLVHIGELEITGEGQAEVEAYFAPDFKFHGQDGREWDYEGLHAYLAALRAAFDELTIKRASSLWRAITWLVRRRLLERSFESSRIRR